jgi:hypothetical protein
VCERVFWHARACSEGLDCAHRVVRDRLQDAANNRGGSPAEESVNHDLLEKVVVLRGKVACGAICRFGKIAEKTSTDSAHPSKFEHIISSIPQGVDESPAAFQTLSA